EPPATIRHPNCNFDGKTPCETEWESLTERSIPKSARSLKSPGHIGMSAASQPNLPACGIICFMAERHTGRERNPTLPRWRLYRPIFTQFNARARRVIQDHAGPFCTMKMRTARDFCANLPGSGQTGLPGR